MIIYFLHNITMFFSLTTFDSVLVLIVVLFGLVGLWFGFIHTLGSLLGTVFGIYLASRYYAVVGEWFAQLVGWNNNFTKVLFFVVAFVAIARIVGLAFWFLRKVFKVVAFLPFMGMANRILGLAFGVFEGLVSVSFGLFVIVRFPFSDALIAMVATSLFAPFLLASIDILLPLLPEALRLTDSVLSTVEDVVAG